MMGSPIEGMLWDALVADCRDVITCAYDATTDIGCQNESRPMISDGFSGLVTKDDVILFKQPRFLGYYLDMMLWSDGLALGIECDGFDFHDRTKQQAAYDRARDREMAAHGVHVIRFTGSEIHRDVNQCSRSVMEVWKAMVSLRQSDEMATWSMAAGFYYMKLGSSDSCPEEHW